MDLEKVAEALRAALPSGLKIRVFDHLIDMDMPNRKGCIEISKRGLLFKRVIARVYLQKDEEDKLFEIEFGDPVDKVTTAFNLNEPGFEDPIDEVVLEILGESSWREDSMKRVIFPKKITISYLISLIVSLAIVSPIVYFLSGQDLLFTISTCMVAFGLNILYPPGLTIVRWLKRRIGI